jgi:hypothetical protein
MGLYTHGMAGIKKKEIYESFSIPRDRFQVISGFALGVLADVKALPEDLRMREYPSSRHPLSRIWLTGKFSEPAPNGGTSPGLS